MSERYMSNLKWKIMMPNRAENFANNVAGNANPNASFSVAFMPILMEFFTRLMDCLFNRAGQDPQGAILDDEFPDPTSLPATASPIDKSVAIKGRIDSNKSSRPMHVRQWGGYRPAFVRRGAVTLLRTARDHNNAMTMGEAKQHFIATLDQADGMSVEELAGAIEDESAVPESPII